MFVQIECTIKKIVYVQFSNDICSTERYHSYILKQFYSPFGGGIVM